MIEMSILGADDDSRMSDQQPLLESSVQESSEGDTRDTVIKGYTNGVKTNTLRLRKELSVLHGVGLLVADIIGSGIFLSPNSVIARTGSYGLSILIWIVSGIIAAGGALCYGELSTFVRKSGADYAYIQEAYSFKKKNKFVRTVGNLISFTYLWMNFFVSDPMSLAISGLLAAEYLIKPFYLNCDPPTLVLKMLAIVLLAIPATLNMYSVKLTLRIVTAISMVKFIACACISIFGIYYLIVNGCDVNFIGSNFFKGSRFVVSDLSLAFYSALYAYDGWSSLNFITEEAHNVMTIPKAIMIGMPLIIICYIAVNLSFFAVLTVSELSNSSAVALPFGYKIFGTAGEVIFSLFVPLSVLGGMCSTILSGARLKLVAARDGLFPTFLSGIHNDFYTPLPAILIQSSLSIIAIVSGNLAQLVDSYSTGGWIFYGLAFGGLLIMRVTHRKSKRRFKVFIILPIIMVFVAIFLVFLPIIREPVHSIVAFSIILSGVPVYFIFVHDYEQRPKIFTTINEYMTKYLCLLLNTSLARQYQDKLL